MREVVAILFYLVRALASAALLAIGLAGVLLGPPLLLSWLIGSVLDLRSGAWATPITIIVVLGWVLVLMSLIGSRR